MTKEIKDDMTAKFQDESNKKAPGPGKKRPHRKSRFRKKTKSDADGKTIQKSHHAQKTEKEVQKSPHIPGAPQKKMSRPRRKQKSKSQKNRVRVIPIGGVEEVGRNMIIIEVGDDIFLTDVGFEFSTDNMTPGVDYILPNTKYLESRKNRIKGVFITHAHLDHIGGIPFIMERIGNPPIFTRKLSASIIEKRQEEFPGKPKLRIHVVEPDARFKVGHTFISTFAVTHSIPDAMGVKIETPQGNIIISGDLKLDHDGGIPTDEEKKCFSRLGQENNLFFIADSTNAEKPGFSITEREVQENIAQIIRKSEGRLIISTFASQITRMIKIINVAKECGKKVVLEGRSIRSNLEIAEKVGLFDLPKNLIIDAKDISLYPPGKILILATGAQGEEFASLNRIAMDKHNDIKLNKSDTILFSSSVIPGNESAVQALKDLLFISELSIMHYRTSDIHSTGHGNAGELIWINQQIRPKYFMPGYGYRSMTHSHAEAISLAGFPRENIVIAENGTIIDFIDGKMFVRKEKVEAEMMIVDGGRVGELQTSVIKERQLLAQSGFFNIIITLSAGTGHLKKLPDVVTCGFLSSKDSKHTANEAKKRVRAIMERWEHQKPRIKMEELKGEIEKKLSEYLLKNTSKRPVVVATFIDV
ncbi:MAG: ribonuclease J [Oligoflexales bacterium]|nr:ribonuclease J [Oligoflexales bacterium]